MNSASNYAAEGNERTIEYRASGKDVFSCKTQLKADGFTFNGELKAWYGSQSAVEKFNSRGFRVKVFFAPVEFVR